MTIIYTKPYKNVMDEQQNLAHEKLKARLSKRQKRKNSAILKSVDNMINNATKSIITDATRNVTADATNINTTDANKHVISDKTTNDVNRRSLLIRVPKRRKSRKLRKRLSVKNLD